MKPQTAEWFRLILLLLLGLALAAGAIHYQPSARVRVRSARREAGVELLISWR